MKNILEELSNIKLRKSTTALINSVVPVLQQHNLHVKIGTIEITRKRDVIVLDISFSPNEAPIMFIGSDYVICLSEKVILDKDKFEKLRQVIGELKRIGFKLAEDLECRVVKLKVE